MDDSCIENANRRLLALLSAARPMLVDVRQARDVIPGLGAYDLLHAGPPLVEDDAVCGALDGAIRGTLILDGAPSMPSVGSGLPSPWRLRSADECSAVGTFGGVISSSTSVFVIEDVTSGTRAFSALNEGRGTALRYGSTAPETLERMRWLNGEFSELLGAAIRQTGAIDVFAILEHALQMGDDGHSRQKAGSALFLGAVAPALADVADSPRDASRSLTFLAANDFFFLPIAMASAKSALRAAETVPGSTIVTAIAFNGARCGIRLGGGEWATSPVPQIHGEYFRGHDADDAGPVIGDSEIMETLGLGACAMASAPALARYVGGSVAQATAFTNEMYRITVAEHPRFRIPALDGRGTPFGIDARKVVEAGVPPVFNTGIAHRAAGVGQIGAGYGRVPLECFHTALAAVRAQ